MQKQKLYVHEKKDEGQDMKVNDLCKQPLGLTSVKYQEQKNTTIDLLQNGICNNKVKHEKQDSQLVFEFEHEQSMKLHENTKQGEPEKCLTNIYEKAPRQKRDAVLCNLCGKSLKSDFYLKSHMIKHTGAKDYHCTICKENFSLNTKHHLVHTARNQNINCTICKAVFKTTFGLKKIAIVMKVTIPINVLIVTYHLN